MGEIDRLLGRRRKAPGGAARPATGVAVVTCMDARIDPAAVLGLSPGEAHVIRNAGAAVTDDVLRSLVISQRYLGTTEVLVIAHTECGMTRFAGDDLARELAAETGIRPRWAAEAFADPAEEVRQSLARLRADPHVRADAATGAVYDVATGALREVE